MERRLAAILAADVVGYSRLVRADEANTLAAVKFHREAMIEPKLAQYHGRIVKLMGDGLLAEFPSAVEAVHCAVELQQLIGQDSAAQPEDRRISYRMGINIGDIIVEDNDIFGDGVNVAARLEGIAEPGGICIARNVYNQVKDKLDLTFQHLGEKTVKNIAEPVSIYGIPLDAKAAALVTPVFRVPARRHRKGMVVAVGGLVVLLAAGAAVWWQAESEKTRPVLAEAPALPQTDKPTLVVLPFTNLSDDPGQDYFADGMAEDLITDLSKLSGLTVISRTSSFAFKGKQVDVRDVGKSLSARYVIEGSVRKVGEGIRINTQLTDATTGGSLWAERYEGSLNDIFDLQDRVLEQIASALALELSAEERRRLTSRSTDSVVAHDLYLRGLFQESSFTQAGYREATQLYEQALAIDPDYALPYARIANILELSARNGWSENVWDDLERAVELAEKAIALDPENPQLYWSLGRSIARFHTPEALDRSIKAMQKAIELDPDFADAYAYLAVLYVAAGRAEDGLRSVETAMRMKPDYPFWYLFMRGMTRYVVEDYESAIADFELALERSPTALFVQWWLAASYAQVGRIDDAQWQYEEMQLGGFDGTISTIIETQAIQDPGYLAVYREGLRKAGIPE